MSTSLLPPNASGLDRAVEQLIEQQCHAIGQPHRALWTPETCPIDLLPWLAWSVGVQAWRSEWPEHIKRAIVRNSIAIQRRRGTLSSVRDAVQSFGASISIREWWQTTPKGTPHTFELVLTVGSEAAQNSATFVEDVVTEVNRVKPLRSHFTFIQGLTCTARPVVAAIARPIIYARLDATVQTP